MSVVEHSMSVSLMVQILTGIITLQGSFMDGPKPLKDIIKLETAVQFIEAAFYAWAINSAIELKTLASKRYSDWVLTTPTMLVSTIMYMRYLEGQDVNWKEVPEILAYNLGMLVFGYMGEVGILSKTASITLGFACFARSFHLIYTKFGKNTEGGKKLFQFMFIVWGLYGVAATLPDVHKNVSYNMLDIIAKNFYGIYIVYKLYDSNKPVLQTGNNSDEHNELLQD